MVRKDGGSDTVASRNMSGFMDWGDVVHLQTLEDAKGSETKVGSKDREEPLEKRGRPAKLGQQQDDNLEYDQQTADYSPEDACCLVGNGTATEAGENKKVRTSMHELKSCETDSI